MGGVNVMDRRNYIELLSDQIRCKKALPLVTRELEVHIEEQKADFIYYSILFFKMEPSTCQFYFGECILFIYQLL